jgi:hypothetical protein
MGLSANVRIVITTRENGSMFLDSFTMNQSGQYGVQIMIGFFAGIFRQESKVGLCLQPAQCSGTNASLRFRSSAPIFFGGVTPHTIHTDLGLS